MTTKVKITKVGNSSAVILPKEILDRLNLKQGDELNLTTNTEGITLSPYDAEFLTDMELADAIMNEDRDVLHKLAQ